MTSRLLTHFDNSGQDFLQRIGQMFTTPISYVWGRKITKDGVKENHFSTMHKVMIIAAYVFTSLATALLFPQTVGIGFLALQFSSSHKTQYAALKVCYPLNPTNRLTQKVRRPKSRKLSDKKINLILPEIAKALDRIKTLHDNKQISTKMFDSLKSQLQIWDFDFLKYSYDHTSFIKILSDGDKNLKQELKAISDNDNPFILLISFLNQLNVKSLKHLLNESDWVEILEAIEIIMTKLTDLQEFIVNINGEFSKHLDLIVEVQNYLLEIKQLKVPLHAAIVHAVEERFRSFVSRTQNAVGDFYIRHQVKDDFVALHEMLFET